ncbi:MAG: Fe-S cluster assembly protein HesB [Planctomycetes bacterium]|nr:Fe-S cluster assembly protein HesB [Planctomycetota bacterium]
MSSARLALPIAPPFELRLALFGHGWIDLAPHGYDAASGRFATVVEADGAALDVAVTQRAGALQVRVDAPAGATPSASQRAVVRTALRRILRLDHDFTPLWQRCAAEPGFEWVARRGAGRLLAGASLFEDLLKLLFTTNCSWDATRLMTRRLVDALGPRSPSGRAAFPSAAACAKEESRFWRDVVRVGYRERSARRLAEEFASGALTPAHFEERALPTDEVRRRLLAIDGFGPYAAGQALRLLGRHDDLALDSWCRARFAKLFAPRAGGRSRRPPADRTIARRYARFGEQRGLMLWLELTAGWHGEGPDHLRDDLAATLAAAAR